MPTFAGEKTSWREIRSCVAGAWKALAPITIRTIRLDRLAARKAKSAREETPPCNLPTMVANPSMSALVAPKYPLSGRESGANKICERLNITTYRVKK